MDKILIRGLEIEARHGVLGFEKLNSQRFIFDVDIFTDFYGGAMGDDIEKTVNYADVCNIVEDITKNNTFNLIEKLAYECAFAVLDKFHGASGIKVTVYKPQAPVNQSIQTVGVCAEVTRERVYLSIGSSMGDRENYLNTAIKKLSEVRGVRVKKVSSYISTEPYGGVAQNEFLNCAAEIETYLTPHCLLEEIHRIEGECGRERKKRWDDRTLDIDVIFFGRKIISDDDLTVPHPGYAKRDFVLIPLKEIAPEFVCPDSNKKIKDL